MSGALRELLVSFGVEVDSEKLEHFEGKLDGVIDKAKTFAEVFLGSELFEKFGEFVEGQIRIGDELHVMAERLGTTTEDLQRFQLAAQLSGASAEDATNGLRFFNRSLGDLAEGGGESAKTFAALHVDTAKLKDESVPLVDKLAAVADGFGSLESHGQKTRIAMQLFGRGGAALIPMLEGGREEIEKMMGSIDELGGTMNEEFIEKAKEAEHASIKMKTAFQVLKSRIATELLPSFVGLTTKLTGWIVSAIKLSKETNVLQTAIMAIKFGALIVGMTKIVKLMKSADGGVLGFIKSLGGFLVPILIIGALYLVFDSLWTMMNGGKSVIGDLLDEFFGVGTAKEVTDDLWAAWKTLTEFWDGDGKSAVQTLARVIIAELVTAVDALIVAGEELGEVFFVAFHALKGDWKGVKGDLEDMGKHFSDFGKRFSARGQWAFNGPEGEGKPKIRAPLSVTREPEKGGNPYEGKGRQAVSVEINNHISGVSDPKEAAKQAGKLTRQAVDSHKLRSAFAAQPAGG